MLSRFIVNYPSPDDIEFAEKMSRKYEFRELLENPRATYSGDEFFYNYQEFPSRWMAPWTNNRAILLNWDPGTGKTRGGFNIALKYIRHSNHKKVIFLASSSIILKAIDKEIIKYFGYEKELQERKFKTGPSIGGKKSRAQGKQIVITRIGKKLNFIKDTVKKFWKKLTDTKDWKTTLREQYKDYVFIVDEAHEYRETTKGKQNYIYLMDILDTIRDICPIILMSGTPIVDTWKDLFSLLGMLLPPDVRRSMEKEIEGYDKFPNTDKIKELQSILSKYGNKLISVRKAENIVPTKAKVPQILFGTDITNIQFRIVSEDTLDSTIIDENLYFAVMSEYQSTEIILAESGTNKEEAAESLSIEDEETEEKPKSAAYSSLRQLYEFTPPRVNTKFMTTEELVSYNERTRTYAPSEASDIPIYGPDNKTIIDRDRIFKMYWLNKETGEYSTKKGLGRHSAKYAKVLWLLHYNKIFQNRAVFIHTLWVEVGTKLIAAALVEAGWEQYAGLDELKTPGTKPRFAVIHGRGKDKKEKSVSESNISRIIEAFNHPDNHYGDILKVVVGSKKSGISISFINTRAFIELSPDFKKYTRLQSEGRVLRADSLLWLPNAKDGKREVYSMDMIAIHPPNSTKMIKDITMGIFRNQAYDSDDKDGDQLNPTTIELFMSQASERKFDPVSKMLKTVEEISIENLIMNPKAQEGYSLPEDEIDYTTHALLYGGKIAEERKQDIFEAINNHWYLPVDEDDMYTMKASADLISRHALAATKYGMLYPVQPLGNTITAYTGSSDALSMTYTHNFFITNENRGYTEDSIQRAIQTIMSAPKDEYEFISFLSSDAIPDVKLMALELSIAKIKFGNNEYGIPQPYRGLILSMYGKFWEVFKDDKIVHILWYGIKNHSHRSKLGINTQRMLKTRVLFFDPDEKVRGYIAVSHSRWKYIDSSNKEALYLTMLAQRITDDELKVRQNASKYGKYLHLSLYSGKLRLRDIVQETTEKIDNRKLKMESISLKDNLPTMASILGISIDELLDKYSENPKDLEKDLYYEGKKQGIIIIR